jgi:hypothetical protein
VSDLNHIRDLLWEFTRDSWEPADYADKQWVALLKKELPREPLPAAFLEEVLAGLNPTFGGMVLEMLAKVGRHEIADIAAKCLATASGDEKHGFAAALARLDDSRGYVAVEALFREGSVPRAWLTADLLAEIDTPRARAMLQRLEREAD